MLQATLRGTLRGRCGAVAAVSGRRLFSRGAVCRADLVQELYLRELRAVTQQLDRAALASPEGSVVEWSAPGRPAAPAVEAADAALLQQYRDTKIDVTGAVTSQSAEQQPQQETEEDWLVIGDARDDTADNHH
ncbi:F1F0 ATP synthase subunit h KNAG_0M00930 [Huiozyma naganishii CBS 8797]|uniref:Uncharacterized protein n=1 Tax=Huiozyma naganishii (strain ATCC MYA-139 / BCRC 22969 / CBS 8797 / KCTC 17520 / NBRC 10181 / NCYC 3082 / Yp74L-3) TaxID=1071383 RepID=J7SBC1_HUIN7|nr:hypothetical protein KNAG_0M00930 [Kazachstania naganishii CBS 8797]CCK72946.1 hypothetical protein KNAG_0M00930 [Kazachstania naganishii CBS 8797]